MLRLFTSLDDENDCKGRGRKQYSNNGMTMMMIMIMTVLLDMEKHIFD